MNERRSIMSSRQPPPHCTSLPIGQQSHFSNVADMIRAGGRNRVISIESPTGSGKSIICPQNIAMGFQPESNELVIVLMPIVAGAIGAAARVSSQGISAVAWTGQSEKPKVCDGIKIVYMTYGCFKHIVLQTKGDIFPDRRLHIIADEVHVQTEEVLFALKALAVVQKNRMVYPTILSITVMSATLDQNAISAMFDGEVDFQEIKYVKSFKNGPLKRVEVSTESLSKFLESALEQVVKQLGALSDSGSFQHGQTILVIAPGVNAAKEIIEKCRYPNLVFWNRFEHRNPPAHNEDQTLIMIWSCEGISTSVTIPNLGFLIIIGMCKNMSSTRNPLITQMGVRQMTNAEEIQSEGRADRTGPTPKLLIKWKNPRIPEQEHSPPAILSQFHIDLIEATLYPASEKDNSFFLRNYVFSYKNCMKILSSFVPPEIFLKLSKLKTVSADDKRKLILLMELMLRFFGKSTSIIGQIVYVDMVEVMGRRSRVQLLPDDENALIQFCLDAVIRRKTDGLTLPPKFTFAAEGGEGLLLRKVKSFIHEVTPALSVFGYFDRDKIDTFTVCNFLEENPRLVQIVAFTGPYIRVKSVEPDISQNDSGEEELVPCSNPIICPFGIIFPANEFSILSTGPICFKLPETLHSQESDEDSDDDEESATTGSETGSSFGGSAARSALPGFSRGGGTVRSALPGFGGRGGDTVRSTLPGFGGIGSSSAAAEPRLLPPGQGRGAPLPSSRGRGGKF